MHDNVVRFEAAFDIVRSMFRASSGDDFTVIGDRLRFHAMPSVTGLRLADSMLEPMIQLADLLCGFVRSTFSKLTGGESLTSDELALCADLLVVHDEFYTWDGNMPKRMRHAFVDRSIQRLRRQTGT